MTRPQQHIQPIGRSSPFLERNSYRRRRLMDAARLLPLIGMFLWVIPVLWASGTDQAPATSFAIVYLFGVWAILILASVILSIRLRGDGAVKDGGPQDL